MDLVGVLEVLDDQEADRTHEGEDEARDQAAAAVGLRKAHGHGHGHAGEDQHAGVDAAHHRVEVVAGVAEDLRVAHAQDGIGHEETAEEQHLGGKEQPDAELRAVELLLQAVEVVREVRVVRVAVVAMAMAFVAVSMRLGAVLRVCACDGLAHVMLRACLFVPFRAVNAASAVEAASAVSALPWRLRRPGSPRDRRSRRPSSRRSSRPSGRR